MTDPWLVAVAVTLIVVVPFDWYVALRFLAVARMRPYIPLLNIAAFRSVAIAIAATIAGVLGFQSIYFAVTGERFLPVPIPTVLIAIALIVVSLPNFYALRWLRRLEHGDGGGNP